MPLTDEQIKDKIRVVLSDDSEDYQEALMSLVIIPLLQSYGLEPPYDIPAEAANRYNNCMADVAQELGII